MSLVHYLTGGDGRAVDIVQEFEHLQCMGFFNRHYDRIKGGGGGGRRDRGWGKREGGGGGCLVSGRCEGRLRSRFSHGRENLATILVWIIISLLLTL